MAWGDERRSTVALDRTQVAVNRRHLGFDSGRRHRDTGGRRWGFADFDIHCELGSGNDTDSAPRPISDGCWWRSDELSRAAVGRRSLNPSTTIIICSKLSDTQRQLTLLHLSFVHR
jgi:hypothetical protein